MARPIDGDKERFWRDVLARWTASGLSIAAFCGEAGLSEQSFYRWRRVLRQRRRWGRQQREGTRTGAASAAQTAPLFVPLTVATEAAATVLEVVVGGGRVVRVPAGFDASTLAQVLAVLEDRPC
jgi:transposase-like protein